jgi:hypothetical protein
LSIDGGRFSQSSGYFHAVVRGIELRHGKC